MTSLVEAIGHARHCPTVCLTADKATAWFAENNAAADELRDGIRALLADLKKADPHHFAIGLMCVRLRALLGDA